MCKLAVNFLYDNDKHVSYDSKGRTKTQKAKNSSKYQAEKGIHCFISPLNVIYYF